MSARRDPYFGRFAFLVTTVGVIITILGLAFIWYFFQAGGTQATTGPLVNIFKRGGNLPPNQVLLYYTKDGKHLVGAVADIGNSSYSPTEKAKMIVTKLVEGKDAAFLRSPIPAGTKVNAVFVTENNVIVDLSKEYMNNLRGGLDNELLAVYSIVNSVLYNLENADSVQILIDGKTMLTLGGQVDIESPLIANATITRAS